MSLQQAFNDLVECVTRLREYVYPAPEPEPEPEPVPPTPAPAPPAPAPVPPDGPIPTTFLAFVSDMVPGEMREMPGTKFSTIYPTRDETVWGITGPYAVMDSWGGAYLDTKRLEMGFIGGGHGDYGGNEIYIFSIRDMQIRRTNYDPNGPVSTHTYQGLLYLPNIDKVYRKGGSDYPSGDNVDPSIWLWDRTKWEAKAQAQWGAGQVHLYYNGKVYIIWSAGVDIYDPVTDTYTARYDWMPDWMCYYGVLDEKNKRILTRGQLPISPYAVEGMNTYTIYDDGGISARGHIYTTGDTECDGWSGLSYDTRRQRVTAWDGYGEVGILINDNWKKLKCSGVSPVRGGQGIFSKWQYVAEFDVFIGGVAMDKNLIVYKPHEIDDTGTIPAPTPVPTPAPKPAPEPSPILSLPEPIQGGAITDNVWVSRRTLAWPHSPGSAHKHIVGDYDTREKRILFWGGDYEDGVRSSSHDLLWSYRVAPDKWDLLIGHDRQGLPGFPAGRCHCGFAYDKLRHGVWMCNGDIRTGRSTPEQGMYGLYFLDLSARSWAQKGPENPTRYTYYLLWMDAQGKVCTLFSRWSAQVIKFDPENPNAVNPRELTDPYDPLPDGWVMAGPLIIDDPRVVKNQVAVDEERNRVIIYAQTRKETYAIDRDTGEATLLSKTPLPVGDCYNVAYYPKHRLTLLFGGFRYYESPDYDNQSLNDLFIMGDDNIWRKVIQTNAPSGRQYGVLIYDPDEDVMVQFGGQAWELDKNGWGINLLRINPATLKSVAV